MVGFTSFLEGRDCENPRKSMFFFPSLTTVSAARFVPVTVALVSGKMNNLMSMGSKLLT